MPFEMMDERHLKAMEEIGKRRTRAIGISFAVTLGGVFGMAIVVGVGLLPSLAAGIALGGVVSKLYVDSRKPSIIRDVCAEYRLDPAELDADKYILDQAPKS